MSRLPVAVIGVGHLGKEHARILATLPDVELVGVADPNRQQAEAVAARVGTRAFADHRSLLGQVKAAVVAAPTGLHHAIAADLLRNGVSLLVEKPLAVTREQGAELVALARKHDVLLQVGHIERFNPAFEELQRRSLTPRYLRCERQSGFTGRSTDVGVVLDLMIHDLDLVLALAGSEVVRVEAVGAAALGGHEDIAQARVVFANGLIADLAACRVSPEPCRKMQMWAAEGYAGVDFATRQLTVMQPGEALRGGRVDSRRLTPEQAASLKTDLFTRFLQTTTIDCNGHHRTDQLTRELQDLVACVRTGKPCRVGGEAGLAALELACRISELVKTEGLRGPLPRMYSPVNDAA